MPPKSDAASPPPVAGFSNRYTLFFTGGVCIVCAVILSLLASTLHHPQEEAKDLDQNEQMLIAAKYLAPEKHFLVRNDQGQFIPANFDAAEGYLIPCQDAHLVRPATSQEIDRLVEQRIRGICIDEEGTIQPFASEEEEKLFVNGHQKLGYAHLPKKLLYLLMPNLPAAQLGPETQPEGYLLPVNGFGLWGPIYGYLAIESDGDTVVGTTWYLHGETPGLGANISEPEWQSQFAGKKVYQRQADGSVNYDSSPAAIVVVKGKVHDIYGNSPLALNAVDGMSGATLTGNGVTAAYKDILTQYRPFLTAQHKKMGTTTFEVAR